MSVAGYAPLGAPAADSGVTNFIARLRRAYGGRIVTYGGGGAATHHHRLALLNGAAVRPGGAAAKLSTTCGECAVAGEGVSKS
jgi:hypothetical protein